MKKLLHERLREQKKGKCTAYMLTDLLEIKEPNCSDTCDKCIENLLRMTADEIERYYIPRPRFEDGEPLKDGDEIDYEGETVTVIDYLISSKAWTNVHGKTFQWVTLHLNDGRSVNVLLEDKLKRPTPKVYDADGVEIKVGDTVWEIEHGYEYSAIGVNQDGIRVKHHSVTAYEMTYQPDQLTHERPVFDADGVRICKGDTVWDLNSREKLFVVEFANRECGLVQCSNEDGDCEDHDAHNLTHHEPDSFEKLRDDIESCKGDYDEWASRLTALIERGV